MDNINFMTIDPSKRSTGIFIKSNVCGISNFTIKFNQKIKDNELFKSLNDNISGIIKDYQIDLIFIENNPFSGFKKSRSPSKMAEIIGIIKVSAITANNKIKIIELSNQLWKGILKGLPFLNKPKNKKYKEQAEKYLKRQFNSCDEVDAYCIGLAMKNLYKGIPWTDAQVKTKNKIINICKKIEINKLF